MARSLNRAQLLGNLTRDPELRYTPAGTAVCSFGIATNRNWTTDTGEKREEVEFHKIVAWNKLAEICSQFLSKGKKVYVEGRLTTRSWTAQDNTQRTTTEIVIDDMILLDSAGRKVEKAEEDREEGKENQSETRNSTQKVAKSIKETPVKKEENPGETKKDEEEVVPEDIPF